MLIEVCTEIINIL